MRVAADTGGTFTDLVVDHDDGQVEQHKAPTTPADPVAGILEACRLAADAGGLDLRAFLSRATTFIHGTTRAVNAIIAGTTARTAFLTTQGHPDVLVFREGGRTNPFDYTRSYPEPYVPRWLTFEVPERITSTGDIVRSLDEDSVVLIADELRRQQVEAVGICLLWSVVNPAHERRVGELLDEHLSGVPFTLSYRLNPTLREYRRASSTVIDASLKPLMASYLRELETRLRHEGFRGRLLVVTSGGGVREAGQVADEPIHTIKSGPAMTPLAGRHFAQLDSGADHVIVADTGGTTFDVTMIRRGRIPTTRETWLGAPYFGHMTGFPSVDIKSIGAGGGSIAWVDDGGLLRVGPRSAGAVPGPAAYSRGGTRPTVTDASVVLGHIDPGYFLGGRMSIDADAARRAVETHVAVPLGLSLTDAAAAIVALATDQMVLAIKETTIDQGVDPAASVLVAGGGAAGLNAVAIARRLGIGRLVIPELAATLSAAGALVSDLTADFAATFVGTTEALDVVVANAVLDELRHHCDEFVTSTGGNPVTARVEYFAEARYPHQVWELEVPLRGPDFVTTGVEAFTADFHALHRDLYAVSQPGSEIEILALRARVISPLPTMPAVASVVDGTRGADASTRRVHFVGFGEHDAGVLHFERLTPQDIVTGPAVIESPFTTVVIDPGATAHRSATGSLVVTIDAPSGASLAGVSATTELAR